MVEPPMVTVDYDDLFLAFDFVSSDAPFDHAAYISLDTGAVYWVSEDDPFDEELPPDLETSDRYSSVPHKNELDLGSRLALRFADEILPHRYNTIAGYFRQRGAYGRFKNLLADEGLLDKWYSFESAATEKALSDWCAEHGIQISKAIGSQ